MLSCLLSVVRGSGQPFDSWPNLNQPWSRSAKTVEMYQVACLFIISDYQSDMAFIFKSYNCSKGAQTRSRPLMIVLALQKDSGERV